MLLRIAIVDDLPQDAERLQQALTAEGQTNIIRYESGDALLSAISPEQLDALFLDICMEGTNGIDTARKLREQAPTLPIVFVTSSKEYVWQSFPVHPFDYLLKPFEQARIRQLLDDLLRILQHPEPEIEVRFARKLMRRRTARCITRWRRTTSSASRATRANAAQRESSRRWKRSSAPIRGFWSATAASSST